MFGFLWRWFGWSSSGQVAPGGGVCATITVTPRVTAAVTVVPSVDATPALEVC